VVDDFYSDLAGFGNRERLALGGVKRFPGGLFFLGPKGLIQSNLLSHF
jgi:hypothetical protein